MNTLPMLQLLGLHCESLNNLRIQQVTNYCYYRNSEEFPRAYVVIHESSKGKVTPESIQEWIKSKVAKHKFLTGGVVFVDEVPKLASGKIQRKVMREWAKRDAAEVQKTSRPKL
jgi:4-coumarate--CoA ligase